ncbi:DNA topoisomerase I [Coccomyxa subellipsoidea C-169]|uniref:DNA topoisomerase n=1 Tax=Coccomyxa subellipsoidea (strain C-169) TaxID=574566 RepID=I0Z559_COCSC|nr:DNA topoisomerase I [Coccomyxa subellipsoidea C-169]EIE25778.1 DNA topoisomerase I [Coccomyxa subellipsoidea C-169]|eukprot:XP_005650322.1 DNA topoisomerase I [Coccomyxa subellipsoidea C-169]
MSDSAGADRAASAAAARTVILVESPAKAKKIQQFLGTEYQVLASYGHVRDLPAKSGSVLPEQDFTMLWEQSAASRPRLRELAAAVKQSDVLVLATDPDREGEAISWHVQEELQAAKALRGVAVQRITFTEVTSKAVQDALAAPRTISQALVDAYLARRALDYLFGFTLSPLLWRKLPGSRSAGRVQSVALRLVCEREAQIEVFTRQEYWSVTAQLQSEKGPQFEARLVAGKSIPQEGLDQEAAASAVEKLQSVPLQVASLSQKTVTRNPQPPFITSTLQQDASVKLGYNPSTSMQLAQQLYEGPEASGGEGMITYMRTDGLQMSAEAVQEIRSAVQDMHGKEYLPAQPRIYKSKAKNAQEAHEAIRPTKAALLPQKTALQPASQLYRLYALIWARAIASQMASAKLLQVSADVADSSDLGFLLRSTSTSVKFPGYLAVYPPKRPSGEAAAEADSEQVSTEEGQQSVLLGLAQGQPVRLLSVTPEQHFTKPPPRYTEASLVKALEEHGIGRPSTYAPILKVLQERGYVMKEGKALKPESRGRVLTEFLQAYFPRYVDYGFTASLEDDLDEVSGGNGVWKEVLRDFWGPFQQLVQQTSNISITEVIDVLDPLIGRHFFTEGQSEEDARRCPECGGRLGLRLAKHGGFIGCSGYPACTYLRPLQLHEPGETPAGPGEGERVLGADPANGREIRLVHGPYGWYLEQAIGPEEPKEKPPGKGRKSATAKPKRVSLGKSPQTPDISLAEALDLLQWPKELGPHPEDGQAVTAAMGPFGPYVRHNAINASLPKGLSPGEIGLEDAIKLLAEKVAKGPSRRGRQPAAKKAAASTKAASSKEAPAKDPAGGSKAKAKSGKAAAADGGTDKPVRKSRKLVVASEDAEGAADVNLLSDSKPGRTRKAAVNGHVSKDEAAATVEAPIKAKRGRPKKVAGSEHDQAAAGDLSEAKANRSRKAAPNGQVSQDEAAAAAEDAPVKAKRGRPKKIELASAAA